MFSQENFIISILLEVLHLQLDCLAPTQFPSLFQNGKKLPTAVLLALVIRILRMYVNLESLAASLGERITTHHLLVTY
ncbi:hypothetical protein CDL12_09094 [Handroanthus impetiginosus]|uniref:Uncharacterized protein n=1 Tax=Handroanthus impetiginosus TaxID=429701 RepID=A0A2G9HL41_9LAMI|nr:hypothetical protein CDL12_09094 [Handroanthus impetiginosus]